MFIDLSNQREGDGRGFQPVPAQLDKACKWDKHFAQKNRLRLVRLALRRFFLNRKA